MTSSTKFVRIVALGIRDAIGLGRSRDGSAKPTMEDVLNRLHIQGFRLAQEIIVAQDTMIAVCVREGLPKVEETPAIVPPEGEEKPGNGIVTPTAYVGGNTEAAKDLGAGEVVS